MRAACPLRDVESECQYTRRFARSEVAARRARVARRRSVVAVGLSLVVGGERKMAPAAARATRDDDRGPPRSHEAELGVRIEGACREPRTRGPGTSREKKTKSKMVTRLVRNLKKHWTGYLTTENERKIKV